MNIQVVCRFRPLIQGQQEINMQFYDEKTVIVEGTPQFNFDRIFHPGTQQEVFEFAAEPVIRAVLEGFNGTVVAYGQTASGKTHTMEGGQNDDRGIVKRMVDTLFEEIDQSPDYYNFTISISVVELYLEKIRDLQQPKKHGLQIREDKQRGIYITDITETDVQTKSEIYDVLKVCNQNRQISQTQMNEQSSRSHMIFIMTVNTMDKRDQSIKTGKLYLVDLAGSEKVSKTGAEGKTLDEAKKINQSLSNLGQVITALTDGQPHVPYRSSKLTRILQNSFGGNSKTTLIITCSPSQTNLQETLTTLRFGTRAKAIKNKPKINKEHTIDELKLIVLDKEKEILLLKEQLSQFKQGAVIIDEADKQRLQDFKEEQSQDQSELLAMGQEIDILNINIQSLEKEVEFQRNRISQQQQREQELQVLLETKDLEIYEKLKLEQQRHEQHISLIRGEFQKQINDIIHALSSRLGSLKDFDIVNNPNRIQDILDKYLSDKVTDKLNKVNYLYKKHHQNNLDEQIIGFLSDLKADFNIQNDQMGALENEINQLKKINMDKNDHQRSLLDTVEKTQYMLEQEKLRSRDLEDKLIRTKKIQDQKCLELEVNIKQMLDAVGNLVKYKDQIQSRLVMAEQKLQLKQQKINTLQQHYDDLCQEHQRLQFHFNLQQDLNRIKQPDDSFTSNKKIYKPLKGGGKLGIYFKQYSPSKKERLISILIVFKPTKKIVQRIFDIYLIYHLSFFFFLNKRMSEVRQLALDKDQRVFMMEEIIKSNNRHIEHLKSTIQNLKTVILQFNQKLVFEQKRYSEKERDNILLKEELKKTDRGSDEKRDLLKRIGELEQQIVEMKNKGQEDNARSQIRIMELEKDNQNQKIKIETLQVLLKEQQIRNKPRSNSYKLDGSPQKGKDKIIESQEWITSDKKRPLLKLDIPKGQEYHHEPKTVMISQKYEHDLKDAKLIATRRDMIVNEKCWNSMAFSAACLHRGSLLSQSMIIQPKIFDFQTIPDQISQLRSAKLFEQFYIMGCDKKEFQEFDNNPQAKEAILTSSIMFRSCPKKAFEDVLTDFAYPFGNRAEKIRLSDSFRKLKEIIFSGNKFDLMDKFHIFNLKDQEPDVQFANQNLLDVCNPERNLYGICLTVYDFIETTPDNIEINIKNRKKRIFWKYKKTYCFLTYFPFYELYQDLLVGIINLIKINRTDTFLRKSTHEFEVLKEVDGQSIIREMDSKIIDQLNKMQIIPETFSQLLEIPYVAGILKHTIPSYQMMNIDIRLWSANIALQILSSREIINIFCAIILEQSSVVFVSERIGVMTAVIHFFHQLLQPMRWQFPTIYVLPESLLNMMESPTPILLGINLSEADLKTYDILDKTDNFIIYLDNDQKISQSQTKKLVVPYLKGLFINLDKIVMNTTNIRSPSPAKMMSGQKKLIKYVFDDQDNNRSRQVLECFHEIMQFMINKIPPRSRNQDIIHDNEINYMLVEQLFLENQDHKDSQFMRMITKTQNFNNNKKKRTKTWNIRVKDGQIYTIYIERDAGGYILVKLNECILESKAKNTIQLSIDIEGLEFILSYQNDIFVIYFNGESIEEKREVMVPQVFIPQPNLLEQSLDFQSLQVKIESLFEQIFQNGPRAELQQIIEDLMTQCQICKFQSRDESQNQKLDEMIAMLAQQKQILAERAVSKLIPQQQNNENQQQDTPTAVPQSTLKKQQENDQTCIVCLDKPREYLTIPCGHKLYCQDCIQECMKSKECFYCKEKTEKFLKVFN